MLPGQVIYQSAHLSARYVAGESARVVVCFPDRVHPTGFDQPGWAEGFLTRRGLSAIYVSLARIDWFQCPDFLEAMRACGAFLQGRAVTVYGSSMGGYAALLSARTLRADLCLALSPQYSIDPAVVPFERRYNDYASQIGPFLHDLAGQASDACSHVVAYDPTHRLDARHLALIEQSHDVTRLPVYGAGHGVLPYLTGDSLRDDLARLLTAGISVQGFRNKVRQTRRLSLPYLRRMGNKVHESGHGGLYDFAGAIKPFGQERLVRKWRAGRKHVRKRPKLVVHCGLPKTGTTSLQAHFYENAAGYRKSGIHYPTAGADRKDLNHAWFSRGLREGDVGQLGDTLESCPEECHTVFLSDESLFVELPGLSDMALSSLAEVLQGIETEIVLFERDPLPWKRSFYLQSVQNRRPGKPTKTPSARNLWQSELPYEAFFEQDYCQALLDFPAMQARLAAAFGGAKLTVLRFEAGQDVVPVFHQALGWEQLGARAALARNPSITDTEAEILRQANGLSDRNGRFIKALIALPEGFDPARMRSGRLEKLRQAATRFPWESLVFRENPPLEITPAGFLETLESLKRKAEILTRTAEV